MATAKQMRALANNPWSRETMRDSWKKSSKGIASECRGLGINLDTYLNTRSPGKHDALGEVLDNDGIRMNEVNGVPSSTIGELGDPGSRKDEAAMSAVQRTYSRAVSGKLPKKQRADAFKATNIASGSVFNPWTDRDLVVPPLVVEVSPEMILAEQTSITGDTHRVPRYSDELANRKKRRVAELAQLPIEKFAWSEDAKVLYKKGIGIQWSYEAALVESRLSLLNNFVARVGIQDSLDMVEEGLEELTMNASANGRTHNVAAQGSAGKWTFSKYDGYRLENWTTPFRFDWFFGNTAAIQEFRASPWSAAGNTDMTAGQADQAGMAEAPRYYRDYMGANYFNFDTVSGLDSAAKFLFLQQMQALGMFTNTGMTVDETARMEGNQSFVRYFSMGYRFYPVQHGAYQLVTLQ